MITKVQINFLLTVVISVLGVSSAIQAQQQARKIQLKLEPKAQSGASMGVFNDAIKPAENEKSGRTPNGLLILVKRNETNKDNFHIWIDVNNNGKLNDEKRISLAVNEKSIIEVKKTKNKIATPFEFWFSQWQSDVTLNWRTKVQAAGKINVDNCSNQIYLQDSNANGVFEHSENGTNFQIDRNNDGKIWGADEHLYSQEIIEICGENFLITNVAQDGSFITIEKTNLQNAKVGARTPQFELSLLNGKKIKSDELTGKPVLLDFWASWCLPCIEKLSETKKFEKDISVFFINTDQRNRVPEAERIINEKDILYNSVMSGLGESDYLWKTFGRLNRSIPFYVLIDAKGIVFYAGFGGDDLSELKAKISELQRFEN